MNSTSGEEGIPLSWVIATGTTTLILASTLAYVFMKSKSSSSQQGKIQEESNELHQVAIDKNKYPGGEVTIYFASQTGTAESFANEIQREGAQHGFFIRVVDLEDTSLDDLIQKQTDPANHPVKAIFLVATYGEGEPTDNSSSYVMELKEHTGIDSLLVEHDDEQSDQLEEEKKDDGMGEIDVGETGILNHVQYAVFGLGNKQYEHYNNMSKFFNHALYKLGAKRVAPIGLGNDDDDLEGDFETWKDQVLWPHLEKLYVHQAPQTAGGATNAQDEELPDTPYAIEYSNTNKPPIMNRSHDEMHSMSKHYFTSFDCPVTLTRELRTPKDNGSTLHMEIDISKHAGLKYNTADNLGILPHNDISIIQRVAKALGYTNDLDKVIDLHHAPTSNLEWHGLPFPTPCTVEHALMYYCDLTGSPRRSDLKLLARFARNDLDRKALLRMSSKEGKAEYKTKIHDAHLGWVDLLELCPSIEMPLEHWINVCPRLMPRYYTISSSSRVHPQSIHVTVSVTEMNVLSKQQSGADTTVVRKGVCSGYLSQVAADKKNKTLVTCYVRDSTFRLPSNSSTPIIMIGPGTGVAPMRALLQERQSTKAKGKNILYFGCKNRNMDYIYQDELQGWEKSGVLNELHVAFSRETPGKKVYVQHLLMQRGAETYNLMVKQNAYIYICGGTSMGHGVIDALRDICIQHSNKDEAWAKDYLHQMTVDGRLVQELWA